MKRKLLVLAVLVGICAFKVGARPLSASFPLCNHTDCAGKPDSNCTCPAGTINAGQPAFCGTWMADCNDL
jgi:hypothetical protein